MNKIRTSDEELNEKLISQVIQRGGTIKVIAEDEWLSMRSMKVPEIGISGYTYIHNVHSNGKAVAILPYKGNLILLRREIVPPWGIDAPIACSITGACDVPSESPRQTAARELLEEAGYRATPAELLYLGECYGTKATDTIFDLYAIDVTGMKQGEALGDGSLLEQEASTCWVKRQAAARCQDPLVSIMLMRLIYLFPEE